MTSPLSSVIVIMLENRSFDHMLGYLQHPDPQFGGLTGSENNPAAEPAAPPVSVSPSAGLTLPLDAAHDHAEVLLQLTGRRKPPSPYSVNNTGFVASYEGIGLRKKKKAGLGALIMKCQPPANVPVLSALATGYAVCTRWFSSVPGQTWPNRNFAHSGTSDGEVDNSLRLYSNRTIFEQLGEAGRTWEICHQGAAQSWAFPRLWRGAPGGGFSSHGRLLKAIAADTLPNYAFLEPDHFWPWSSSQHPANNRKDGGDFRRGEELVRRVYSALVAHPKVFAKTLLVVTYDEHGGLFDHVPPPQNTSFEDGRIAGGGFRFDLLGVRVPAVLVSPWIAAGTVITDVLDHSSIIATLRALFVPGATALTPRVAKAAAFHGHLSLPNLRTDLPALPLPPAHDQTPRTPISAAPDEDELDEFQNSLVWLTEKVAAELSSEGAVTAPSTEVAAAEAEAAEVSPLSSAGLRARQEQIAQLIRARRSTP